LPVKTIVILCALALLAEAEAADVRTQARPSAVPFDGLGASLTATAPDVNARLIGLERAEGVLLGALASSAEPLDAAAVLERMRLRFADTAAAGRPDPASEKGFAVLGPQGAALVRRAHAFHREVAGVFAGVPPAGRKRALDAAVRTYRSQSAAALPDVPKDMTILYDHPYTSFVAPVPPDTEPRRALRYPKLTGFIWASHWYELAVLEALEDPDPVERSRALQTVADRFGRKLSDGVAPDGYPSELPLAPAIAPGLVALNERAASVVDNLNMMLDVVSDVLVHPAVQDRRGALSDVIRHFTDRQYRCVQDDEWIVVALRHSIFDQGGFALAPMRGYERNAAFGGHGQHYAVKRAPPPCDPEHG
jgi:hypothetical protein